jgi:hypothetical protein
MSTTMQAIMPHDHVTAVAVLSVNERFGAGCMVVGGDRNDLASVIMPTWIR